MAGTDTGGWAVPGLGLHHELELLTEAGLTPMQAIQAATRNTAEGFRLLGDWGPSKPESLQTWWSLMTIP